MAISYASYTKQLDYVGGANPIYVGTAPSGSAVSDGAWTIQKMTYDGNNNVTSVTWASAGVGGLIWNNRTTYVYS